MKNINNKDFKFVVVGGGAAGWLSALFMRKHYPQASITVIESSEIGILGAGEGTTPHFIYFLNELDIAVSDIVKYASGTFKNAVKFTNWNGDGKHYYHGFANTKAIDYKLTDFNYSRIPLLALEKIGKGKSMNDIDFVSTISDINRVKIATEKVIGDTIYQTSLGAVALHFNANSLAKLLKTVGKLRDIKVIDGIVDDIKTDADGYINQLVMSDSKLDCDFVFDCTGFKRLIIGKFYKSEWNSYKDSLPVNKAIPFILPLDKKFLPPYTEAIALKYGWMWKIPTQERYGCGYVYDSNMISDDKAKEELDKLTGTNVDIVRSFSFDAGAYKRPWIKNCLAVGLSSGFLEPLEATSIWSSCFSINYLLTHIKGVTHRDQQSINLFNENNENINEMILAFLHLHYHTKRTDTSFWKDFAKTKNIPKPIQLLIDNDYDITVLLSTKFKNDWFEFFSFCQVGAGLNFFNNKRAMESFEALVQGARYDIYSTHKNSLLSNIKNFAPYTIEHYELLRNIRSGTCLDINTNKLLKLKITLN